MTDPPKAFRIGSILWAIVLGTLVVVLDGSILLPSTKRARIQFQHPAAEEAENAPTTFPATQP